MRDDHHVLIATHDAEAAAGIKAILNDIAVGWHHADTGKKAFNQIKRQKPPEISLIVADEMLPDMKGIDLLEQVGRIAPDIQRFLTAGPSDITAIVDAVNRGRIHKYIAKPWQNEQLRGDLRAGLKQYELIVDFDSLFAVAKEQNSKLYALNRDLKESARKQSKTLISLNSEIHSILKSISMESIEKDDVNIENEKASNPASHAEKNEMKKKRPRQWGDRLSDDLMKSLFRAFVAVGHRHGITLR